jgi:glycosyltransferase involved in cell wall biosynthesis
MQKILHIVEPLQTGIHTFLRELTNHQCDKFDVFIAYGIRPYMHKDFKNCFDKRIHWIKVENFQYSIGFKDLKAFFELKHILREVKPDIIHLHSSKAGFLGRWAYNCSKHKVFYTPNGLSFLMQNTSEFKKMLYWLIEYLSAQRKAVTIACGKGEYEEASRLSRRCTYVSNGINTHNLKLFIKEKISINTIPLVCTSGRISYQKNPKLFNELARLLPHIKFLWIGEGEMKTELTAPNITITGWVNQETAIELTANADFFILPSFWEGLPLSLLEAMYLKKICLVSDIIGNRDIIRNEENGFICHNTDDYLYRINQITENKLNWKPVIEEAHKDIAALYNTDSMAAKYEEIYHQY